MTPKTTERLVIEGPAGDLELVVNAPEHPPRGLALVAHPHPLQGGTLDNKVAVTLAKTFFSLGYAAVRFNFRGVGRSSGTFDEGRGETDDALAALAHAKARYAAQVELPVALAGFSFGAYVQTRVAKRVQAERLALVGVPDGLVTGGRTYRTEPVPTDTIVIHGELDETAPLANALDWARPQELPIVVVPGADHFFHRRLHLIRDIIKRQWKA